MEGGKEKGMKMDERGWGRGQRDWGRERVGRKKNGIEILEMVLNGLGDG